ncbi:MAG: stage III sporulation AC/AD family protein [Ruminococcus sp.]|nr:stage III sporulation AC/AD family protein [Ruminococcus sp.]
MDLVAICVLCVVISVLTRVLARDNAEFSALMTVCTVAVVGVIIIMTSADILELAKKLYSSSIGDNEYFSILARGAGICIITSTAADCCRDCNESALASSVETAGRLAMLLISFPLFSGVLSIVEELIK